MIMATGKLETGKPEVPTREEMPLAYRLVELLSRPFVRLLFRPRISGLEGVPAGGFVLAANHLSGFDMWALGYPLRTRWLRHMAKPQLFERRLLGPLVRILGAFPADDDAVDTASRLARAGYGVVVMPEGARRRADRVHRPHTGAARVALAAAVPLVPAGIQGTDGARRLRRWKVAYGLPIPLDDLRTAERQEAAQLATERLWSAIQTLERGLAQPEARPASRSSAT